LTKEAFNDTGYQPEASFKKLLYNLVYSMACQKSAEATALEN